MKPQCNVFIPNLPTRHDAATGSRVPSLDLNPASQYGSLVKLSQGPISPSELPDVLSVLDAAAAASNSDDVILCVGDIIAIGAMMRYMSEYHESVNVLRWDRGRKRYDLVNVTL